MADLGQMNAGDTLMSVKALDAMDDKVREFLTRVQDEEES